MKKMLVVTKNIETTRFAIFDFQVVWNENGQDITNDVFADIKREHGTFCQEIYDDIAFSVGFDCMADGDTASWLFEEFARRADQSDERVSYYIDDMQILGY